MKNNKKALPNKDKVRLDYNLEIERKDSQNKN